MSQFKKQCPHFTTIIFFRWPGNIPCLTKYSCTCSDVFLLWTVCIGTSLPEVFVVEKIFDIITACPVHYCHHPHRPVLFHGGLQVPVSSLSVHHYELWVHLSAALPPFLVPCLHQRSETAQNCEKWNLQKQRSLKFRHNMNLCYETDILSSLTIKRYFHVQCILYIFQNQELVFL